MSEEKEAAEETERPVYHHSLIVREMLCKGCTQCMKKCPTYAIRIEHGKAKVDHAKCINCGNCMKACPHNAITVEDTNFEKIFSYPVRVAIVPAVFFAQFANDITVSMITRALRDIGFTNIYYAETGLDVLSLLDVEETADDEPLISNFCPAANRLVQTHYPYFSDNVSRITPPARMSAVFAAEELMAAGHKREEIGVFYATPCPAKLAQIRNDQENGRSVFDGVLKIDNLFNQVQTIIAKNKKKYTGLKSEAPDFPEITSSAISYCLSTGETRNMSGHNLAVDEIHRVAEFLEILEAEDVDDLDFLEFRSCAYGCVGGRLTPRNRFLAAERLRYWAASSPKALSSAAEERIRKHKDALEEAATIPALQEEPVLLDEDINKAMHKMEKVRRLVDALPGIDCGLCGAPSCKVLAEDVAMGEASVRQCAVLKLKDPKELNQLSRIWGTSKIRSAD